MNGSIRAISIFCLVLFLALLANVTWLQYGKADALDHDSRNRRVIQAAYARERGTITAGGVEVAVSKPSTDIYKYQRTYPLGPEYAAVTGYFSYYSANGVEQKENDLLAGNDQRLFVNSLVDLLTNAEPQGGNVELTIDPKVQDAAWQALSGLGSDVQAAAVAIEPSTGKILAMVSTPSFDPNKLATHDLKSLDQTYNSLTADPTQPMLNRAIQTTLPPGSTFKLITTAAAIDDLGMTPDTMVDAGSSVTIPGTTHAITNIAGVGNCGGDKITLDQALAVSCNTAYARIGAQLTDDQLRSTAEAFGFDAHYFDDLSPQAISKFPSEKMDAPLRALSAIGQYEVTATPLQMAMVAAGIANHGQVMKPYLVDRVTSPALDVLSATRPTLFSQAVSPSTASTLTQMMVNEVSNGGGFNAAIPGVDVAGKTGTAQSAAGKAPYAWFTGFAPATNPKIAVAVLIQSSHIDPNSITGSAVSAPIAKKMMEAVINP